MLALVGCGQKTAKQEAPKKPAKPTPPQEIMVPNASAVYKDLHNEPVWNVAWKSGEVTITPGKKQTSAMGKMGGVSGEIYKQAKSVCTFSSDGGTADKAKLILTLTGHVKLISKDPAATLECDRLVYDGNTKIVKSYGHVRVSGTASTEGTIDELWATPDLKKWASPDMFYQQ